MFNSVLQLVYWGCACLVGIWYVMGLECFELLSHFFFLPRYVDDIYQDHHRKVGKTPRYTLMISRVYCKPDSPQAVLAVCLLCNTILYDKTHKLL